jgi:hypothetical protein
VQIAPVHALPHEVPAHEVLAHEVLAHEVLAHEVLAHEVPAHEVHAHEVSAYEVPAHDAPAYDVPASEILAHGMPTFTSLPSAHDLGGENPYIDTKDVLKLLNCGRLGRQAAGHPWSALRVVKSYRKTAQRPRCCSKLKHPDRYQSSLSKLSTKREGEAGKEAQAMGLAS